MGVVNVAEDRMDALILGRRKETNSRPPQPQINIEQDQRVH